MSIDYRIAVAVHTYAHIDPQVYFNHITVISDWVKSGYNIVFLGLDRAKVAQSRNILVEKAKEMKCTHILFIDADHIIDGSMLPCLLGNTDATAVSGLVVKASEPHDQVGFVNCDDTGMSNNVQLPLDDNSYSVDACAFGCTLIDMSVFDEIEKPYFKDITVRGDDGKLYPRRSDMVFCSDLKKLGKTIRIDTRVQVGHLGKPPVFYPSTVDSDFNKYQDEVYKFAASVVKEGSIDRVIDCGCRNGYKLMKYISAYCGKIIGIDINSSYLTAFKKNLSNATVIEQSLVDKIDLDFCSNDLVIAADVLEHLTEPDRFLSQIPDGVTCIFSSPDISTVDDSIKSNSGHVNFWNVDSFLSMLIDNGFSIITSSTYKEMLGYDNIIVKCVKGN